VGRRQKGKSKKRLRSWHHLPNQDRIYRRNAAKLDKALNGEDDVSAGPIADSNGGKNNQRATQPPRSSTGRKE
jgi:hypothetical protein